ncbi:MAG TPA: PDZ domain-containing protein [Vicinamibacterales bacterium]|nr:PDZ domain-containing protein [Vicinamibacterales bacterium]
MPRVLLLVLVLFATTAPALAQSPITYRVSFPEPEHHWVQVELAVSDLGAAPLHARMSRSSPGRYAVHEFAKNIFLIEAFDGRGQRLRAVRSDVDEWQVSGHDGTVRVVYRLYGDHADGTYMAVDTTHAHMNMPATFLWARGLETRPIRITFEPPPGSGWRVGTQLFPTSDPFTFTAPNLQYFLDSPVELADAVESTFTVPGAGRQPARIRLFVHSDGSQADVDVLAGMVRRIVLEQIAVFGDLPPFEPGEYTLLLDYVTWGAGDGMEHRNSTMISNPGVSLRTAEGRQRALGTISHEFFHVWNVERIRPVGLEPFDFTRENVTCCLWLAEGFTSYYGPLTITRAGLSTAAPTAPAIAVINGSGRQVRSAVEMSEHAPFADAGVSVDAHDRGRSFISYYTYGAAIALGLDLSLRQRSNGRQTLDDFMRLLWERHGKPAGPALGLVAQPYTLADLRRLLSELTGDTAWTEAFFDRFVEGRDAIDYVPLFEQAGFRLARRNPGAAWAGAFQMADGQSGLAVTALVPFATPAYAAGLDAGDVIVTIDGRPATRAVWTALAARRPGESVPLTIRRRDGRLDDRMLVLTEDPALVISEIAAPSPAQLVFRQAWLGPHAR